MKKIVVMSVGLLTLIGVVYRVLIFSTDSKIHQTITARAWEYINGQKKKEATPWNSVNFNKKVQPLNEAQKNNGKITADTCFSLVILFEVTKIKEEGECHRYITFTSPRGSITVYQQEAGSRLQDDPSVMMRRSKAEIYKESNYSFNGREFLIFERSDEKVQQEKTAFYSFNGQLFVLNLTVHTSEDQREKFLAMLSSIEFIKK